MWFPDRSRSNFYRLVSCDAAQVNDEMIKVALVGYLPDEQSVEPNRYNVDIWVNGEKENVEVRRVDSFPFRIRCL